MRPQDKFNRADPYCAAMLANGHTPHVIVEPKVRGMAAVQARLDAVTATNDALVARNGELREENAELEQAVERLEAELTRLKVKYELPVVRMPDLLREVSRKHGLSACVVRQTMKGPADVCAAQQEFCWRAWHELDKSYPQIGRFLGGRHHTTALHAERKHAEFLAGQKIREATE